MHPPSKIVNKFFPRLRIDDAASIANASGIFDAAGIANASGIMHEAHEALWRQL